MTFQDEIRLALAAAERAHCENTAHALRRWLNRELTLQQPKSTPRSKGKADVNPERIPEEPKHT